MANTIKFKRGSGSDPGSSDLSVGEIAIRTDTAKIFTKNDGGSVVEISGGVEDGDITTSKIADDAVTFAKIQNVSATDRLLGRDSSGAGIIEEIAPSAVRTMLGLAASATTDTTNASNISSGTLAAARVATLNQDTTGSAATLTTARNIGGVSFDGSANINLPGVNTSGNQDTSGNAATATALETARTIAGVSFDGSANISLNNNAITNGAGYLTSVGTSNIADEAVTLAKIENFSSGRILGRLASGTGETSQLTASSVRSIINVEDGATADQTASEIVALIADQTIAPSIIDMEDNEKIKLGNSDDLELFHDGSDSFIKDTGTGQLKLATNQFRVVNAANNENLITANEDGYVRLYYDNSLVFETRDGGFGGDDNDKLMLGNSSDLKIYHDGSNSIIEDSGTGSLLIQGSRVDLLNAAGDEIMLAALQNGAVSLYYDNAKKFETTSDGIKVTDLVTDGEVNIMGSSDGNKYLDARVGSDSLQIRATSGGDSNHETMAKFFGNGAVELYYDASKKFETSSSGATVTGDLVVSDDLTVTDDLFMFDSGEIKMGHGEDLRIFHDGSNSTIDNNTGTLIIRSDGGGLKLLSEGNIILRDNDDTTNLIRCINGGQIELYHNGSKKAETVSGGFTVTGTCTATAFAGDGSSLTGISAGATGGGSDEIFYENGQNVTTDYTITNGKNAMSAGPITIDSGVTVTVGAGETLTIV